MTGSKLVDHWTSRTVCECTELCVNALRLQALHRAPPSAADYVSCEAGRRTCSKRETRTEELCEIKWDYNIVGMTA